MRKNTAAISCGEVLVEFIARGGLEKMPVATVNTPLRILRYATPEVTALELLGYPNHYIDVLGVPDARVEVELIKRGAAAEDEAACDPGFRNDVGPLLRSGFAWDVDAAMDAVLLRLEALLPGDPWKGVGDTR